MTGLELVGVLVAVGLAAFARYAARRADQDDYSGQEFTDGLDDSELS